MAYKVCKFGGSSLATREQIEHAVGIMLEDSQRKFMVVSAFGVRPDVENDTKVTQLLVKAAEEGPGGKAANKVKARIREIGKGLDDTVDSLCGALDLRLQNKGMPFYKHGVLAFGEYASARLVSEIAKTKAHTTFIDPKDFGFRAITRNGVYHPDPSCYEEMGRVLLDESGHTRIAIIPGFYLYDDEGNIVTFKFGGSDTTQSCVGNAVDAVLCENFTDVMGLMRADPAIVPGAEVIQYATFEETRELGGFKLEKDSIVPLMEKYIPLMVRSAREPGVKGTTIVCDRIPHEDEYILGITKQEGFHRLRLKKIGVDEEIGFGAKALDVLAEMKIPYKHFPVVTDLATLIVHEDHLKEDGKLQDVNNALMQRTGAEIIREGKIDTIVVAGVGMQKHLDTNARIFGALGRAGIPQLMVDASTPVSIAIGVPEGSGDNAVRAVYNEFYPE